MAIIDLVWFRPNEFQNIAFENANSFGFSDLRVQIVPLFYSPGEKRIFRKAMFFAKLGSVF